MSLLGMHTASRIQQQPNVCETREGEKERESESDTVVVGKFPRQLVEVVRVKGRKMLGGMGAEIAIENKFKPVIPAFTKNLSSSCSTLSLLVNIWP